MRAIIQRVTSASVSVNGKIISQIKNGLCVLIGICHDDTEKDANYICDKLLKIRLWPEEGKGGKVGRPWAVNVQQLDYDVLLVSQFTLYARLKGNKPDYHGAMAPQEAKKFYQIFVEKVHKTYKKDTKVHDGEFGAYMSVDIQNDGPVTIDLDSDSQPWKQKTEKIEKKDVKSQKKNSNPKKSGTQADKIVGNVYCVYDVCAEYANCTCPTCQQPLCDKCVYTHVHN